MPRKPEFKYSPDLKRAVEFLRREEADASTRYSGEALKRFETDLDDAWDRLLRCSERYFQLVGV